MQQVTASIRIYEPTPQERGQHVVDLCDAVICRLFAANHRVDPNEARVAIFDTLADALYGYGTPIDIPTLRRD